jgi:hypothetical protein
MWKGEQLRDGQDEQDLQAKLIMAKRSGAIELPIYLNYFRGIASHNSLPLIPVRAEQRSRWPQWEGPAAELSEQPLP